MSQLEPRDESEVVIEVARLLGESKAPAREDIERAGELLRTARAKWPWNREICRLFATVVPLCAAGACADSLIDQVCAWEDLLADDGSSADAWIGLGLVRNKQGDLRAALTAFQHACERTDQTEAWEWRARTLARLGDKDQAMSSLRDGYCPCARAPSVMELLQELTKGVWDP